MFAVDEVVNDCGTVDSSFAFVTDDTCMNDVRNSQRSIDEPNPELFIIHRHSRDTALVLEENFQVYSKILVIHKHDKLAFHRLVKAFVTTGQIKL
jgi:DNA phosphorothioation-dependent restriction protein DptG